LIEMFNPFRVGCLPAALPWVTPMVIVIQPLQGCNLFTFFREIRSLKGFNQITPGETGGNKCNKFTNP